MMKMLVLILILISFSAQANDACVPLFQNAGASYRKIGGEEEGNVYLDTKSDTVKKVFHTARDFNNAVKLQEALADTLREAGLVVPPYLRVDSSNKTIYREYVEGETLTEHFIDGLRFIDARKTWYRIESEYLAIVSEVEKSFKAKNIQFKKERFNSHGVIPVISGEVTIDGKPYMIRLHADNLIVRVDPKTQTPEFIVIDYR